MVKKQCKTKAGKIKDSGDAGLIADLMSIITEQEQTIQRMEEQRRRAARRGAGTAIIRLGDALSFLIRYCRVYQPDEDITRSMELVGENLLLLAGEHVNR